MTVPRRDLPLSNVHSLRNDRPGTSTRCRRCGIVVGWGDQCDFCRDRSAAAAHVDAPGEHVGRHHTEWVATVDELLVERLDDEATFLLRRLVDTVEAEVGAAGVPPYRRHFSLLADLARRRGDHQLARRTEERYDACVRLARTRSTPAG